jgi:type I restriction enzyme S subunit
MSTDFSRYSFTDCVEVNPTLRSAGEKELSFIEMKDIDPTFKYVGSKQLKSLTGGSRFQNGDTLFARITPCLENGKIAQARDLVTSIGFGSTEFLVFRGKPGITDTDFVYYLSRSEKVRKFAELNMHGPSGRQRVAKEAFENLQIDLPPLEVQTRIAEILSSLDDKIELNRQMNQTLEEMAQALYKHHFVDGIDPENLPEGWRKLKVCDILEQVTAAINPLNYPDVSFIHYSLPAFDNGKMPTVDQGSTILSNKTIINSDCILFSKLNPRFPRVWIVHNPVENAVCSTEFLRFIPLPGYFSFTYCLLNSKLFIDELQPKATGTSGSHQRIKPADILHQEVSLPNNLSEFEQKIIPIIHLIDSNINEIQSLIQTRDYLLPKLISGEILPKDLKQIEAVL